MEPSEQAFRLRRHVLVLSVTDAGGQRLMSRIPFRLAALGACCLLTLSPRAQAQDLAATKEAVAVPPEIAEPIKALLQSDAVVVMRGENRLEFWWVKSVPLDSPPSDKPTWASVPDGALVGVFRMAQGMPDVRGLPMKPGVYTLTVDVAGRRVTRVVVVPDGPAIVNVLLDLN